MEYLFSILPIAALALTIAVIGYCYTKHKEATVCYALGVLWMILAIVYFIFTRRTNAVFAEFLTAAAIAFAGVRAINMPLAPAVEYCGNAFILSLGVLQLCKGLLHFPQIKVFNLVLALACFIYVYLLLRIGTSRTLRVLRNTGLVLSIAVVSLQLYSSVQVSKVFHVYDTRIEELEKVSANTDIDVPFESALLSSKVTYLTLLEAQRFAAASDNVEAVKVYSTSYSPAYMQTPALLREGLTKRDESKILAAFTLLQSGIYSELTLLVACFCCWTYLAVLFAIWLYRPKRSVRQKRGPIFTN